METKSRRRVFVGYDDGSKSVKYYNAETRNILTSRNYHFLSLTSDETPPEPMVITPDMPGEGESEGSTQLKSGIIGDSLKRKRGEEEEPQWRTRGIHMDYCYLHNPFPDEEDEANKASFSSNEELYAIIAGDELTSLKNPQIG